MSRDKPFRNTASGALPWLAPGLAANWANAGGGLETAGYSKSGRRVDIAGFLLRSSTTYTAGTSIFQLPVGYRPQTKQYYPAAVVTAGFGTTTAVVVEVDTSGNVSVISLNVAVGTFAILHGSIWVDT